ncbi:MAG: hypothetical protein OSB63_05575 [Planctomycetota bacterium]|nr:hypothetical protein [Planctomycetota bacterium]
MPSFPRLLTLLVIILTSLFASCQTSPSGDIRDLAAIHDPVTWQPVSNSAVEASFHISDHRQLEEEILTRLGAISAEDFSFAFELSSWMMVMLVHDENPVARRQSLAILGNLAGGWLSRCGASFFTVENQLEIEPAIRLLANSTNATELEAAAEAILNSATPSIYTSLRIMTALGRKIHIIPVDEKRYATICSLALRMTVVGITAAVDDTDAAVSSSAQSTLDILSGYTG